MIIRTQYDRWYPEHGIFDETEFFSEPGSGVKDTYVGQYDERGRLQLVKDGQYDVYGEIQSHKDSVDIHVILSRYVNGDTSVLKRAQGFYADIAGMDANPAVVLNNLRLVQREYDALPVDVKQKFGNSYVTFAQEFGSETYAEKLGLTQKQFNKLVEKPVDSVQKEVVVNEQE